jgi:hypothetical protein
MMLHHPNHLAGTPGRTTASRADGLRRLLGGLALAAVGCGGSGRAADEAPAVHERRCYASPVSAFGERSDSTGRQRTMRGWFMTDSGTAEGGLALLVDADGASLTARWRPGPSDSTTVSGFDDAVRVEFRLVVTDSAAHGRATLVSDVQLERDSSGRQRPLERHWEVAARRAPCDSMPHPWTERPQAPPA